MTNNKVLTCLNRTNFCPYSPQPVSWSVQFNFWILISITLAVHTKVMVIRLFLHKNAMITTPFRCLICLFFFFCIKSQNILVCITELFNFYDTFYFHRNPFFANLVHNCNIVMIVVKQWGQAAPIVPLLDTSIWANEL